LRFSKILAGIALPAGIAFALLAALIVWRIFVLDSASRAEDRADHILVGASMLATNLMHAQNQERGFLLTGSPSAFGSDVTKQAIADGFAMLEANVDDPSAHARLHEIEAGYQKWWRGASMLIVERAFARSTPTYSAAQLDIESTHRFNEVIAAFLDAQAQYREMKSMEVDRQVRIVVVSAIAGSLVFGMLLLLTGWRLLLHEAQRRRREEELEEQNVRMREAARVKGEFVAHMSHEFRTPLTAILALGEMLYDEKAGPLSPIQKQYIDDVLSSGRHLLGLINQVLDVAKLEAGKLSMRYSSCSPCALAEETLTTLRPLAGEKHIALRTDCARAPRSVVTDPGRFRQILYNYLSNALAFTPNGGVVTLGIFRVAGDRYRVEVRDTGSGIAPENMERLFKEFSQVDTPGGFSRDGAGLGLALTKRIVEAQGGNVGAASALGAGSTFYAELPCDPRAAGAAA
jgi:signal transduction histidine kinase